MIALSGDGVRYFQTWSSFVWFLMDAIQLVVSLMVLRLFFRILDVVEHGQAVEIVDRIINAILGNKKDKSE